MMRLPRSLAPLSRDPRLGLILVMIALTMSGNGLVAPILSLYAATFAASGTLIGLIITLFGVGRLLANMPAGVLSQRYGRRPLLVLGPSVLVVGAVGAALATSFETLLLWRFVQGVGSGIYMTTAAALLADLATDEDRGRIMALYQGGLLLGAGIGPFVGGFIAEHLGLAAPFWAYAIVCALALVAALRPEPPSDGGPETGAAPASASAPPSREQPPVGIGRRESTLSLLGDRMFLMICLVNFAVFFTRTASQWQLIPLLGHEVYHLGLDVIGAAIGVTAVANFLMLPVAGSLIDRFGARSVTTVSGLVTVAALGLIGIGALAGDGIGGFWAGMILLGFGSGLSGPGVATCAAVASPRSLYGPAMGLLRSAGDVGFILGPIVMGLLLDLGVMGLAGCVLVNAALFLAATGIFMAATPRTVQSAPAE